MQTQHKKLKFSEQSALEKLRTKLYGAVFLVMLSLVLAACSTFGQAAPQNSQTENPCQVNSSDEISYTNETEGYCLLYPAGFNVRNPEPDVTVIHGPDYSEGPEPLSGFVNIQVSKPAEGRSAAQVSDEIVSEFKDMEDIYIERADTLLGGKPAVEIIGMPGQALSWQVVAIHNDKVFLLVFSPLGEDYGQAFTDMQSLYEIVMRSFAFLE